MNRSGPVRVGLATALAVLLLLGAQAYRTTGRLLQTQWWIGHTYEVRAHINALMTTVLAARDARTDYLLFADPAFLADYQNCAEKILPQINTIRQLTSDNPKQQQIVRRLRQEADQTIAVFDKELAERQKQGTPLSTVAVRESSLRADSLVGALRRCALQMDRDEAILLAARQKSAESTAQGTRVLLAGGGACTLLFLIGAFGLLENELKRRRQAMQEARRNADAAYHLAEERETAVQSLMRSEARLEEAQRQARLGSWELDLTTREIVWSEEVHRVFGQGFAEAASDYAGYLLRIHPNDRDQTAVQIQAIVDGGEPAEFDQMILWPNGCIKYVRTTIAATRCDGSILPLSGRHDENGAPYRVRGTVIDITERKIAEERLQALAAELQRSNESLEEFAAIASHDLKEPLRKVHTFGDLLQRKHGSALGREGSDYLQRMMSASVRMQTLIDGLMAYSRVSTQTAEPKPVSLNDILTGVLSDLEARLSETGGRIEAEALPILMVDPLQMRQLLQNLVGNALKYHKPGVPPVVRITHSASAAGNGLSIVVTDNGIGFEPQYAQRIFTIFERLDTPTKYEGSGVGLAICRKIMERYDGRITAQSTPDVGTTFTLFFPASVVCSPV